MIDEKESEDEAEEEEDDGFNTIVDETENQADSNETE